MTGREFGELYNEKQMKEIARDIAGSIVIRTYDSSGSHDTRRETTPEEKTILQNLAYGAMLAYTRRSCEIDGILDMAEYTLHQFIPEANGYDSIYIPLRKVTKTSYWA